jgi:hypothetical protein
VANAPATCAATTTASVATSVVRRGNRSVSTAITGAPTIMPAANAEIR